MKQDRLLKHIIATFIIALVLYGLAYFGIENRRTRKGPWEVTFTNNASGAPALLINQPALAITNVQITFPRDPLPSAPATTVQFRDPREVPYDVPFGKCIFMDTTFLPGTLVFDVFGHEIQLIPRALTTDHFERPWRSNETIELAGTNLVQPRRLQ